MKNAIITFGVGYAFDDIKYFIESCRKHSDNSDVYVYVGKNISQLQTACSHYKNVHLLEHNEKLLPKVIAKALAIWPTGERAYTTFLRRAYRNEIVSEKVLYACVSPFVQFMVKRFFIIKTLIKQLPHDAFMITDLRDVLLQSDPFQSLESSTLYTGIEPVKICESEMNARWINQTFSRGVYDDLKDNPVVCAGVTIGDRTSITQYVEEMIEETMNNLPKITRRLGPDQAIHIYLFNKRLENITKRLEANGVGRIATLHYSTLSEFTFGDGHIQNDSTEVLAVVHQYDRHPTLAQSLRNHLFSNQLQ